MRRYSGSVTAELEDGVLAVTLENPPVNAVSVDMRQGLLAMIAEAEGDDQVRAIVLAAAGRNFVAGADIREMSAPPLPPHLPEVLARIEASAKPVVAALKGATLGGGCEIALAAHARVAAPGLQIGLPEVKLGIVPGAGGTQRLPRLVGVPAALSLAVTGRSIGAVDALAMGLIDDIAEDALLTAAAALARTLIGKPLRRTGLLAVPTGPNMPEPKPKSTAQREAMRLVRAAASTPIMEGLADERATFLRLRGTPEAKALRHLFFAERAAAKMPGLEDVKPREVNTLGIVGGGLMGAGIAAAALAAGLDVILTEADAVSAERAAQRIDGIISRAAKAGRISAEAATRQKAGLSVTTEFAQLAGADAVIEAVPDDIDMKINVFAALSKVIRADAVLATNTSYLNPELIADAIAAPQRFLGLHFFSPAHMMRLTEVVRCARTSPETLATGIALAKRLKKLPVVCGVSEGFIGNRVFSAYRRQAEYLIEDGALPADVDTAMEAAGFALGPFAVFDMAGLDIAWARRKRQVPPLQERCVDIADRLCELGRYGQKTGRGWYIHENGQRRADPEVTAMIEAASAARGIERRPVPAAEIVQRLLDAMTNEGARLVSEGIAARPSDVDLVLVNGYGFPAALGGPMYAADEAGLAAAYARIEARHTRDGLAHETSPLLRDLARAGRSFAALNEDGAASLLIPAAV